METRARRLSSTAAIAAILLIATLLAPGYAEDAAERSSLEEPDPTTLVRLRMDGVVLLDELHDLGLDTAHNFERVPDGIEIDAFVTEAEVALLEARGVEILPAGETYLEREGLAAPEEPALAMTALADELTALADEPGETVKVGRADYFTSKGQGFISVEAKSSMGPSTSTNCNNTNPALVCLTVAWDTGPGTDIGSGGTQLMNLYVDSGVYMYHRILIPIDGPRPHMVEVTSRQGGSGTGYVSDWLRDVEPLTSRPGYRWNFIDRYMDPTDLYDRMEELAEQHSDIAEIVDLPHETNGYQRKAQAIFEPPPARVVVDPPSSAAGEYALAAASYAPAVPQAGVTGAYALVNDGTTTPTLGCQPLVGFPAGAIALVDRGDCTFGEKTLAAQAAGAVAVVIVNNVAGNPTAPGGSAPGATIPTVMISQADGTALKAGLPAAGRIRGSVSSAAVQAAAVVVTSHDWGHEGGNDVTARMVDPGAPDQPLTVSVEGDDVTVRLATNASGALTSTAAQVAAALRSGAAELVHAHTYRGNAGAGVVQPTARIALSDFLNAPDRVPRGPYPIRALRIGKHRDGSKPGVLIVAQDHAREWVPPVVAQEAMERLLANAATDAATQQILEDVDVFIVPSNNPDGSHYSFHDFASQRRNMTNHCEDNNSDPGRRNAWGVDLNRNFRVGSAADGYSGASFSCISDTYMGPEKLSEPEAKNVVALVEDNPNIKFFMTIHSNGGQLFWQPGSYIAQGRVTTPRPEMRDEAYYWQMADRILSHVKSYQDTVVRPDNVGGSADVLYSSAGNVREDLYNNYGIYAFGWEVGGSVWNPETRAWQGGSFQPNWAQRGHGETMEYANGIIEMFRIAGEWGKDTEPATTTLTPGTGPFNAPVDVAFTTSEPATIYYTTDGSRPTLDSTRYQASGIREGGELLRVAETTRFNWFSVDPAGNIENGYDPDGSGGGYRTALVTIRDFAGARAELDALVAAGGITTGLEAKIRHALEMAEAWLDLPRKQGPALSHLDRAVNLLLWQADVVDKGKTNQGDAAGLRALAATIQALHAASS